MGERINTPPWCESPDGFPATDTCMSEIKVLPDFDDDFLGEKRAWLAGDVSSEGSVSDSDLCDPRRRFQGRSSLEPSHSEDSAATQPRKPTILECLLLLSFWREALSSVQDWGKHSLSHIETAGRSRFKAVEKYLGITSSICLVALQIVDALAISQYDPSHSLEKPGKLNLTAFLSQRYQPPEFLQDPSSAVFATASMTYAFAALAFHERNSDDKYQNHLLVLGVVVGTCASIATIDPQMGRTYIPLSITAAMILSACAHEIWRRITGHWARAVHPESNGLQSEEKQDLNADASTISAKKEKEALSERCTLGV